MAERPPFEERYYAQDWGTSTLQWVLYQPCSVISIGPLSDPQDYLITPQNARPLLLTTDNPLVGDFKPPILVTPRVAIPTSPSLPHVAELLTFERIPLQLRTVKRAASFATSTVPAGGGTYNYPIGKRRDVSLEVTNLNGTQTNAVTVNGAIFDGGTIAHWATLGTQTIAAGASWVFSGFPPGLDAIQVVVQRASQISLVGLD